MIHSPPSLDPSDGSDVPRRFTDAEFFAMGDAGIFSDDEKVELLDGLVYSLGPPDGPEHRLTLTTFTRLLTTRFAEPYRVQPQQSTVLSQLNVPKPDFVVFVAGGDRYERYVDPAAVVLAVEIAFSSLRKDRLMKTRIYARYGVREYWIVDTVGRAIEVYDQPHGDHYERVRRFAADEPVVETSLPGSPITPAAVIG